MRTWLIALTGSALIGAGLWVQLQPQLKDALDMRAMIKSIEGASELDLVADGRVSGTYRSEFRRLPDGGFVSRYALHVSAGETWGLVNDSTLEFSGFPSYALRAARVRQGDAEISHEASDLPEWSLYEHLIVQRFARQGPAFLERGQASFEVLTARTPGSEHVRARIRAPVFDGQEASISLTEFELDWQGPEGVRLHRDGGWFDYDRFGRVTRAQFTPDHQLLPSGSVPAAPREQPIADRSMVPLRGPGIEHPDRVRSLLIDVDGDAQASLDGDEYLPVQSLHGDRLTLRAGRQHAPEQIRDLVALVHHSLVYDESVNSTDVDEIIANGRGDCTEFTDLFHAKAEAAGLEARKILGLAYLVDYAGRPPGFYVHAWNQVRVDGDWVDVDATWNQAPASLARIRFAQGASPIVLLHQVRSLTLTLVEVAYGDDRQEPAPNADAGRTG